MQMIFYQGKMRKDKIKQVLVLVVKRNDQSDSIFHNLGPMLTGLYDMCVSIVVVAQHE